MRAALRNGVQRVIALSTDKAANPINLYGASKLASDKIFIAANNLSGSATRASRWCATAMSSARAAASSRFTASWSPTAAEFLPITDERMTRFWITLQQGVEFRRLLARP